MLLQGRISKTLETTFNDGYTCRNGVSLERENRERMRENGLFLQWGTVRKEKTEGTVMNL